MTPHHTTPSYERAREYGAHTDTHWRFHFMLPHDGSLLGISQFLLLVACFHAWFSEPAFLSQAIRASSCVLKRVATSLPHAANQVWIAAGRVILHCTRYCPGTAVDCVRPPQFPRTRTMRTIAPALLCLLALLNTSAAIFFGTPVSNSFHGIEKVKCSV